MHVGGKPPDSRYGQSLKARLVGRRRWARQDGIAECEIRRRRRPGAAAFLPGFTPHP